jgi:hypothetical protein
LDSKILQEETILEKLHHTEREVAIKKDIEN